MKGDLFDQSVTARCGSVGCAPRRLLSLAPREAPGRVIPSPSHDRAATHQGARKVTSRRRATPGCSSGPACRARGRATQGFTLEHQVPFPRLTCDATKQLSEGLASFLSACRRTGVAGTAGAIPFTRRYSGEAHLGPLSTPDRPITIPDPQRGAGEGLTGTHDLGERKKDRHRTSVG